LTLRLYLVALWARRPINMNILTQAGA
jgi:hypothetical protein